MQSLHKRISVQEIQWESVSRPSNLIVSALCDSVQADVLVAARIGGIHAVLAYLNARTRNRFTGIWPADDLADFAPQLYDRDNPEFTSTDFRELRRICSTPTDHRPASVLSAPIVRRDGRVQGVLCHFDSRLRTSAPSEEMILRFLGAHASEWLHEPAIAG